MTSNGAAVKLQVRERVDNPLVCSGFVRGKRLASVATLAGIKLSMVYVPLALVCEGHLDLMTALTRARLGPSSMERAHPIQPSKKNERCT